MKPTKTDLEAFDAVVWDLDGTLVHLAVDWDEVANEVIEAFDGHGVDAGGMDLWAMLDLADEEGIRGEIEAIIADHEHEGARESERLPHADALGANGAAEGVCSLNCEDACNVALDAHDLSEHVDAVVGRDSVATRKPDPKPLLETIDRIGADTESTVFVGDSLTDEHAADRAGVEFLYVGGRPSSLG
ncbi:HAD family hydrolase [Halopelagius fulvigenes]|uniref:HAD family hydrolase n=1 Tax=Halopelagius fulvigenes TaxID=1198324 RepID=A0ABD5TZG2_9EURY